MRRQVLWFLLGMTAQFLAAAAGAQAPAPTGDVVHVGDRIVLRVAGEGQLSDTFTVGSGPALTLPVVGRVPLQGIRRDSVESVLTAAISRFFRDPVVYARALVRVAVLGEVVRPGYYSVRSDMLIPDVLMAAGGPTQTARVDGMRVLRAGAEVLSSDSAAKAVTNGLTLSQIGIMPADQFVVPRVGDPQRTFQIVTTVVSMLIAVTTVLLLRR